MTISENKVISLRYCMYNSRGEVVEDVMNASPVYYLQGSKNILPALQQQMVGLQAGEKKRVLLQRTDCEAGDDFVFEVVIDDVREATGEEIILGYALEQSSGDCGEDCTCYE